MLRVIAYTGVRYVRRKEVASSLEARYNEVRNPLRTHADFPKHTHSQGLRTVRLAASLQQEFLVVYCAIRLTL